MAARTAKKGGGASKQPRCAGTVNPFRSNRGRGWRSAYRLDIALPLTIRVGERTSTGTTRDVSEGGLRGLVPTSGSPQHGDTVDIDLEVELGHDQAGGIVARSKVVRVEDQLRRRTTAG